MIFLVDLVPNGVVKLAETVGGFYATLIIALLIVMLMIGASFRMMRYHAKSNHALADSVQVNFGALGDTLKAMMDQNKIQFETLLSNNKNVYLPTDLSIDLYRNMATVHVQKKLRFIKKILEKNDIVNRENEIKRNIECEFRRITNEGTEQISRYKSVIGDMGSIINDNVDWPELLEETYSIIFNNKSNKAQKLNDLNRNLDSYINKIEQVLIRYGNSNE